MSVEATREQLKKRGLTLKDAQRLERALCTLADFEGPIKQALSEFSGASEWDHVHICAALRRIVDGEE